MARASFAAGTRILRGLAAGRGMVRQAALLPSHVVVALVRFLELASAANPSGLLVWPLLTSSSTLPA
jgi:hypothetical protein